MKKIIFGLLFLMLIIGCTPSTSQVSSNPVFSSSKISKEEAKSLATEYATQWLRIEDATCGFGTCHEFKTLNIKIIDIVEQEEQWEVEIFFDYSYKSKADNYLTTLYEDVTLYLGVNKNSGETHAIGDSTSDRMSRQREEKEQISVRKT